MSGSVRPSRGLWKLWFALTAEERGFLAGILAIALVGLTARYLHLRAQEAATVDAPAAVEATP